VPISTYRWQLHKGFSFQDAREVVLISPSWASPIVTVRPICKLGPAARTAYDITDHNTLNAELGTPADYQAFVNELARYQMGQVLDFVPNHNGRRFPSRTAGGATSWNMARLPLCPFFRHRLEPDQAQAARQGLAAVPRRPLRLVLERGELQLAFDGGAFVLRYFDHNLPLDPRQFPQYSGWDSRDCRRTCNRMIRIYSNTSAS